MWRRIAAGLVDLALIVGAAGTAAALMVERFSIIRTADGDPLFSAADQARINELAGSLSRGYELGDTLLAFSTRAVLVVLASIVLAGSAVGILLPIRTSGQSVGKVIFGLRVVGTNGSPASPVRHAIRTAVGLADLMPLIVPGLTGFAFAASNPANQRIGDTVAKTVVIDCRKSRSTTPNVVVDPVGTTEGTTLDLAPDAMVSAASRSVDHGHRLSGRSGWKLNSELQKPDQTTSGGPVGTDRTTREHSRHQHHGDRIAMSDSVNVERQHNPTVARSTARRVPVEERSTNPYPKPTRPTPPPQTEQTTGSQDQLKADVVDETVAETTVETSAETAETKQRQPGYDSLALPESSLSDMPLTNKALFEALGLSPEDIANLEVTTEHPVDSTAAETADVEKLPTRSEDEEDTAPDVVRARSESSDLVPDIASAPQISEPEQSERRARVAKPNPPAPVSPSTEVKSTQPPHPALAERSAAGNEGATPEPEPQPTAQRPAAEQQAQQPVAAQPAQQPVAAQPAQQPVVRAHPITQVVRQPNPIAAQPAPIRQPQPMGRASRPTQQTTQPRQGSRPAPDKRSPIWSEDWEAWIYWDTTLRDWFYHDEISGNWLPMEE